MSAWDCKAIMLRFHDLVLADELLAEAGLPDPVFQVVTGSGEVVGQAIANGCDALMFTGFTATGHLLAKTVDGAVTACFSNSRQLCTPWNGSAPWLAPAGQCVRVW